jgi:flagellum-specific peptidoglycan hydrolase FlgJ
MRKGPGKYLFIATLAFVFYSFIRLHPPHHPAERVIERPLEVDQYLQNYHYLANELNSQTGIPIALTLAVAGLESNWGTSELARAANNHFGIKANNWTGLKHCKTTLEYWDNDPVHVLECFRKYSLIRESFQDFGAFIKSRPQYQYLFDQQITDSYSWAYALQAGSYATDPQYAQKLIRVIETYQLER